MRKNSIYLIFLFIPVFFSSCSICDCRQVPCSAFDDPLFEQWFPYQAGQVIVYKTDAGNSDTITINYFDKSPAYETSKGCYGGSMGCMSNAYIASKEMYNTSWKLHISYVHDFDFSSTPVQKAIKLDLYNTFVTGNDLAEKGIV